MKLGLQYHKFTHAYKLFRVLEFNFSRQTKNMYNMRNWEQRE